MYFCALYLRVFSARRGTVGFKCASIVPVATMLDTSAK